MGRGCTRRGRGSAIGGARLGMQGNGAAGDQLASLQRDTEEGGKKGRGRGSGGPGGHHFILARVVSRTLKPRGSDSAAERAERTTTRMRL